jgi:hypothetical protein
MMKNPVSESCKTRFLANKSSISNPLSGLKGIGPDPSPPLVSCRNLAFWHCCGAFPLSLLKLNTSYKLKSRFYRGALNEIAPNAHTQPDRRSLSGIGSL